MDYVSPFFLYLAAFLLASVLCFASLRPTRHVTDTDTRHGLQGLLVLSGIWAGSHVGYLVVPGTTLPLAFYYLGLVAGILAVGAWLYFCSAYTGRRIHRVRVFQLLVGGIFAAIVLVKLTNPLHGMYFQTESVNTPFAHLAIEHGMIHWLSMGLAYALAVVGYFMLLELFWEVDTDTTPFLALLVATALPASFDILGYISPAFLNMTYAPLGVAVFAVGVSFVYLESFQTIKLAGEHDDPILVVNQRLAVRDYNDAAAEIFPAIEPGVEIGSLAPDLTKFLESEDGVIELYRLGGYRYYQLSTNPFTAGKSDLGMAIILTDVTEREQYRQELERQNERLQRFASFVSHDLRNPLNVAGLNLESAQRDLEGENEQIAKAMTAIDRMETLIERLLELARHGQTVEESERVSLESVAVAAWGVVESAEATLSIETEQDVLAERSRLQQLFENLFRNAIEHGGADVTITLADLPDDAGFQVADDGPGIPSEERDDVFEFGYTTNESGTGFGLAIVREIVMAHDWEIHVTESDTGGACFEITGVQRPDE